MENHIKRTLEDLSRRLHLSADHIETELLQTTPDPSFIQTHTALIAKHATGILALTTLCKPPPNH